MQAAHLPAFDQPDILAALHALDDGALDQLPYGVIGFDAGTVVRRYSQVESRMSGMAVARVIGQPLFTDVAPCMNNFLVALRFEAAAAENSTLDLAIDYVLTWRMRPTPVRMRLLSAPGIPLRYLLLHRS